MRYFITGGSGWIGSPVVDGLLARGHEVTALARSDASASALDAKGATTIRGSLTDVDALRRGADAADAVIHLGFVHDFSDYAASGRIERDAVRLFGEVLAGSGRALLLASGMAGVREGRSFTEEDATSNVGPESPRGGSEALALSFAESGVVPVALRFSPSVHGAGDHGFLSVLVAAAREHGVSGYVGDGGNRWPAVHRSDAADLVVRAAESPATATRVHAVAEEGIPTREIAEAIGRALGVPTASVPAADAQRHFGWIGAFFGADIAASSALTRERFGWRPSGPTLAEDLEAGRYTA